MTSNNQVSPVIRISRGERDASARATHLKAASKKYLETTIERKQMSTTTNFKRIALVAVAALGLGVLSSVPSQATINSDVVTLSSATAAQTTAETFTATSATVSASFFGAIGDSITLTTALLESPDGSTSVPVLRLIETSSAVIDSGVEVRGAGVGVGAIPVGTNSVRDSSTVGLNTPVSFSGASSTSRTSIKYAIYMANQGRNVTGPAAGTYKVKITPTAVGVGPLVNATAQTITITVTTAASASRNVDATNSKTYLVQRSSTTTDPALSSQSADSSVVAVRTASTTPVAVIFTKGVNAAGTTLTATGESLTATITGAGTLGFYSSSPDVYAATGAATSLGKSISMRQTDYLLVFPDGNSGVGTITITGSTSGTLIATKTVTFSSATPTKFAAPTIASTDSSVIAVSGTTKVSVLAQDATDYLVSGLTGGTDYYAFSSDPSVATVATYSFSATTGYGVIVTGLKAGTADISFGNASTLAASTIKSAVRTVRVGSATPSDVTMTTDKTSYAPGEKILVTVTILDSTAKAVVGQTSYTNIFSSTGIVPSLNLSGTNTLPSGADVADYSNTTNSKVYTIYAPVTGGTLTFTATGGTALASANRVAKTVSVTVVDSGAAALAAVTALATTVASLRTLIVTLTNLVLKIQKKVRA
jgi:hypothetical protein